MKTCSRCGVEKPEADFHERVKGTGKLKSECKGCATARARAWNDANPGRLRESQRRHRARHRAERAQRQAEYRARTYVPLEGFAALSMRPHTLYRVYGTHGELLYVGITVDPKTRLAHHRRQKPWWPDVARVVEEVHPDRTAALAAETVTIAFENPLHNIRKRQIL